MSKQDKYLIKFTYDGKNWQYAELDMKKGTVRLPSGKTYPVDDDGNVIVDGKKCKIYNAQG